MAAFSGLSFSGQDAGQRQESIDGQDSCKTHTWIGLSGIHQNVLAHDHVNANSRSSPWYIQP